MGSAGGGDVEGEGRVSRLTYVTYLDHDVCSGGAWISDDESLGDKSTLLPAHGMIVGETKELLVLSVSATGGESVLPFRILKSAIRSRVDFDSEKLPKKTARKAKR